MHKIIKSKTKKKIKKPRRIRKHFIYNKPKFSLKRSKNKKNYFQKHSKIYKLIVILLIIFFIISTKYSMRRKTFDVFKKHKVFIEAHRGVNRVKFENTKEAISLAIKMGLDSFETDTWLSKDNVLVLAHARRFGGVSSLYNSNYKIIHTNWAQLSTIRTKVGNLSMPRLEDIMILTKNKIFMNLEIKDPRINLVFPQVTKLIEKYDFFDQISISSFNHKYYQKIVEYNNNHPLRKRLTFGFLYGGGSNNKYFVYNLKYNTINAYWKKINKRVCDKAHSNGMAVMAWFYMGETENNHIYKRLFDYGVDVICSNEPLKAKKFRHYYYRKKMKKISTIL